jgi:hypothetical protein
MTLQRCAGAVGNEFARVGSLAATKLALVEEGLRLVLGL